MLPRIFVKLARRTRMKKAARYAAWRVLVCGARKSDVAKNSDRSASWVGSAVRRIEDELLKDSQLPENDFAAITLVVPKDQVKRFKAEEKKAQQQYQVKRFKAEEKKAQQHYTR